MRKLRFYLGGKNADHELHQQKMHELEESGFESTLDWLQVESSERTPEHFSSVAERDIKAIHSADLVIVILDDMKYAYRGTSTVIGAALGLDKPVILVCPDPSQSGVMTNVFCHHPFIYQVHSWEEAKGCLDIIRWYKSI